jgi:poly-gamma-glutamate synthesis protein (capsule biosynthesis protein)
VALGALLVAALFTSACGSGGSGGSGDAAGTGAPDGGGEDGGDNPAPTTTEFKPRSFTVAASGDILLHNYVIQDGKANAGGKGYNFDPMFDQVRDTITAADLAICHQETPTRGQHPAHRAPPSASTPKEIATALKNAGSTAATPPPTTPTTGASRE